MKVSELKKGMLLTCVNDNEEFTVYGEAQDRWVRTRIKSYTRKLSAGSFLGWPTDSRGTLAIMYLGTKKDLNIKQPWTDKFVLINNEIAGVDPYSWRYIKELK